MPLLLALSLLAPPAHAQVDPANFILTQSGREAGRVFVATGQDACHYTEYWFLYPGFDFISVRTRGAFSVVPDGEATADPSAFLARMWAAHPDGRLMTSVATDTRNGCR